MYVYTRERERERERLVQFSTIRVGVVGEASTVQVTALSQLHAQKGEEDHHAQRHDTHVHQWHHRHSQRPQDEPHFCNYRKQNEPLTSLRIPNFFHRYSLTFENAEHSYEFDSHECSKRICQHIQLGHSQEQVEKPVQ